MGQFVTKDVWCKEKREWLKNGCDLETYRTLESSFYYLNKERESRSITSDLIEAMRHHKLDTMRYLLSKLGEKIHKDDIETIIMVLLRRTWCYVCDKAYGFDSTTIDAAHFSALKELLKWDVVRCSKTFRDGFLAKAAFQRELRLFDYVLAKTISPRLLCEILEEPRVFSLYKVHLKSIPAAERADMCRVARVRGQTKHFLALRLTHICMALRPLCLPPYVLLEIIECLPEFAMDTILFSHKERIDQVCRILEKRKRVASKQSS